MKRSQALVVGIKKEEEGARNDSGNQRRKDIAVMLGNSMGEKRRMNERQGYTVNLVFDSPKFICLLGQS
jgi:hypothetical protein